MKLKYERVDSLPRLAWCAEITKGSEECKVIHGPWVETRRDFFVEGAWDGPFEEGAIDQTHLLMGSGGRIVGEEVVFATACHTLERLFVFMRDGRVVISPSLGFLLTRTGENLDLRHIPYQTDLLRLVLRMKNHVGSVRLAGGKAIMVVHYRNIIFNRDGDLRIQLKTKSRPFRDFNDYKQFLVSSLKAILENASAPTRNRHYQPIVTVSSGYDSNACAAIASEVGCKDGVTFRDARQKGARDSGAQTGKLLGLKMKEFARDSYKDRPGFPEAEFLALGDLGQDLVMSAFQDDFTERVVIIGTHGDRVWDRHAERATEDIVRHEMSACCMTDFKFRVGFVLAPLAFFGCINHPSLHRISNSPEMTPWWVGNAYDRPIPRRIVEENGVSRSLFGQKKKQVTVLLNSNARIRQDMKPDSLASFVAFYHQHKRQRNRLNQFHFHMLFLFSKAWSFLTMKVHGVSSRLGRPVHLPTLIPLKYQENPGMPSFLVHWALPLVQARYLASVGTAPLANGLEGPQCQPQTRH